MTSDTWEPLIEGLLEAVLLVDRADLSIRAANRAAGQLLQREPANLVGRPMLELVATPEDLVFWQEVAAGVADQILSDTLFTRADGSVVEVTRRVTPAQFEPGANLLVVAFWDRSEQLRVEGELERLLAEMRATLESTADGILVLDLDGGIRGYNHRFAELWQLPEHLVSERDDAGVLAWMEQGVSDPAGYRERLAAIQCSPLSEGTELVLLRGGRVLERVTLPQYARGRPIGRVFSFRDISRRLADEARLELAGKVFERSLDAIFVTDANYRVMAVNPSFERLTGYPRDQAAGKLPRSFIGNRDGDGVFQRMREHLNQAGFWEGEAWNRRQDGSTYLCLISAVKVQDDQGITSHYVGFFKDLSETHAARKRIEQLAYHDALTGLPNRLLFSEHFDGMRRLGERNRQSFAVLFIDLDRFKHINDSLGHLFGDQVLVKVAERLKSCLREVDTLARLGGDEFLILLNQVEPSGAETIGRRILTRLAEPLTLMGITFTLTCSIGITLFPQDGATLDELIKNADSAMYAVKERGRSGFGFYTPEMNVDLLSRVKLDHAIRQALERDGFHLCFQPQIDLRTGALFGAEALIRWHDPELGQVSPAVFIPVAEESGTIVPLGDWVLTEAVRQAAIWYQEGFRIAIAINVSALQFHQPDFVAKVAAALVQSGLPPGLLELELTESILIQQIEDTVERLGALAQLGVHLSIDDFGTGYSSLAYLKRFPIQRLKIDQSFVRDVPGDESDVAIVHAIVDLGHALRLRVIAEGVELIRQRQFLEAAGCDEMQGFLYSPALEPGAFELLLRSA